MDLVFRVHMTYHILTKGYTVSGNQGTHDKLNQIRTNLVYLIKPGTTALRKVAVPVIIVHVEGGEGEPVVAVHGVSCVAVVQVLVVQPERVPFAAHPE